MKSTFFILFFMGLVVNSSILALNKKEREEFSQLCMEVKGLQRAVGQLNETAQQIHNVIVDVDIDNGGNNNQLLNQMAQDLEQLKIVLLQVKQSVQAQEQVLGNIHDVSVPEEDINDVEDIDSGTLSLISLLKSVFRQQLADKFIS